MARVWGVRLLVGMGTVAAESAPCGPLHMIFRRAKEVRFKAVYAGGWVRASRVPADIVCNANFFWAGRPLGLVVKDGKLVSRRLGHKPPRTAFVVQRINGVQKVGITEVYERRRRLYAGGARPKHVDTLVQGGPRLTSHGRVSLNRRREGFRRSARRGAAHSPRGHGDHARRAGNSGAPWAS